MRSFLLIALIAISITATGQITINPNPSDINSGIITITYGASGDYSIFDPMNDPNLLLYTGLQTDADPATWDYHDDFSDTTTFIPFNFDSNVNAYVAQIDVRNRVYQEEPNLNLTTVPTNTMVNDFYFLIITTDLSRQSADLKGTDYGWQAATTLSVASQSLIEPQLKVANNVLYMGVTGDYTIITYDLSGRLIENTQVNDADKYIFKTNPSDQIVITRVTSINGTRTLKHQITGN